MKQISKYVIWLGMFLIVAGFIYDVAFVNLPYQDAPPELEIRYQQNQNIAYWTMIVGLVAAAGGGLLGVIVKFTKPLKNKR